MLVIDAKEQVVRCEGCGKEYPLVDILPCSLVEFAKIGEELKKEHKNCAPQGKEKGGVANG